MDIVMKIYHKLSKFALVRYAGQIYRNGSPMENYKAYKRLKELNQKKKRSKRREKITVIFLVQSMSSWGKHQLLYETMKHNLNFNVHIVVISELDNSTVSIYDELRSMYSAENIMDAKTSDGWFDIETLHPDYVFYQKPYDDYIPSMYRSAVVSRYAKVCYFNYGFTLSEIYKIGMPKRFFRNVSLYFAETKFNKMYNTKRFSFSHKKGIRKSFYTGYPALEDFLKQRKDYRESMGFKVIWTPRWSEDAEVGGSNFFRYKENVGEFFRDEQYTLVFRPHPMLFSNSIKIGKMTKDEVAKYLEQYKDNDRKIYDDKPQYAETFWQSDVLLTDFSSVVIEYFLTGKPIIYCYSPAELAFTEDMERILDLNYVANSWEEASKILCDLKDGRDPKKEKREVAVNRMCKIHAKAVDRIIEKIEKDFY